MTDDLLPISGLQHLVFCERQCALIHVERLWSDNARTVEGTWLHRRVDEGRTTRQGNHRVLRRVALRSSRLGLIGYADAVEVHTTSGGTRYLPVETKRGRRGHWPADAVQLCAQAMCLEEMLGIDVTDGAVFYARSRRRRPVRFEPELRARVANAARRLREIVSNRETPPACYDSRCRHCSLADLCLPREVERDASARYVAELLAGNDRVLP